LILPVAGAVTIISIFMFGYLAMIKSTAS